MNPPPASRTSIAALLDILPDAVLMVDAQGRIVYGNAAVEALVGYAAEELLGRDMSLLLPAPLRARHARLVAEYQREGAPRQMGARPMLHALHRNGQAVPMSISLCNWTLDDGQRVSVAVLHHVGELHSHLDRATTLAETDALSGLGNRLRLSRWMQALLAEARPFALLYMDLRRFKPLNDTLGHAAGDEALRIVAQRLKSHVREADHLARLGGDEFVILLPGLDDAALLAERAQAIADTVAQPLRLAGRPWTLGANLGGALHPRHGHDESALLHAADAAMYRAKQAEATYCLA